MRCWISLFLQRWCCALSGSVRGRIGEFRDAHKGRAEIKLRFASGKRKGRVP
jgi:hypothetical protein